MSLKVIRFPQRGVSHWNSNHKSRRWKMMRNKILSSSSKAFNTSFLEEFQIQLTQTETMALDLNEIYKIAPETQESFNSFGIRLKKKENSWSGDFYSCLRPFLILGRVLGILPICGLFNQSTSKGLREISQLHFGWATFPVLCSIPLILILGMNVALSFLGVFKLFADNGGGNATQLALAARYPVFYSVSFLVYIFFLLRSKPLIALCSKWRTVTTELDFKERDLKLCKQVWITGTLIFGLGMVENLLYTLRKFPIVHADLAVSESNLSTLETYYSKSLKFWAAVIPYNIFLTLVLLVVNMFTAYSWTYADVFIVLCSRALYYKFKILVDQTNRRMAKRRNLALFNKINGIGWAKVRKDHLVLCQLLDDFETFLSPLIFLSYCTNIFSISLEIHQGLTPQYDHSYLDSAFSLCSFVLPLTRILAVSLTASKVNEYAHQITNCIQKCLTIEYCKELERLEHMLATSSTGLNGLGCFVVTKAFLLMVLSVIFTVEIVLLQASASAAASATNQTFHLGLTTTPRPL